MANKTLGSTGKVKMDSEESFSYEIPHMDALV